MSVEITLELGHRASLRSTPTPEGFTHDWVVFVRGVGTDANNIHYFVEKVVFILHESFPKHKRVVKEPPYQVAESGYAGFIMPIEIHFRSKEEPKKVCFEYDLFLRLEEPVFHIRYEKLTFQYPTEDFRKKLLKGGGGCPTIPPTIPSGVPLQTQVSASLQHSEEHRSVPSTKTPGVTAEKKPRSHSTPKESNKPVPPVRSGQPFTDIFGSPIKAKHSSGNPSVKTKEGGNSNHQKSARVPSVLGAPCKELKPSVKDGHCITESKNSKITKPVKQEKEPKIPAKRAFAIDGKISSAPDKKKRRASTSLDDNDKIDVIIKPKDSKEKKEKHKNKVSASANSNRKETEKLKTKTLEIKESIKFPKTNSLVHKIDNKHPSPQNGESNPQELEGLGGKEMKNKLNDSNSPVSEITKNNRPLSTMIAEMDNVLISPLSSDAEDTRHVRENEPESDLDDTHISMVKPVTKSCVKQDKKLSKSRSGSKPKLATSQGSNVTKDNQEAKNSVVEENIVKSKKSLDPSNLVELVELQQKIMSLNDRILLQRVVDVIEKTGRFQMTSTSFDFDLCSLDRSTLKKLNCLLVK